jgi:hypothetical protein
MFRFIPTSDWQLGARFPQFGVKGNGWREVRLGAHEGTLKPAQELAYRRTASPHPRRRLGNGDPVRQERILDVLVAHLQILISICHPDRYHRVGQGISITA